ncbi:MAG: protochlorophyllide oxidoreductase [Cyanobacteria bacterium J083]|nr:MAG: protochlorophyllide oxidoreductase [Cyanobacteria bacterium J083]
MLDNNYIAGLPWTRSAIAKLKNVPFFVRPQARQRIEELARAAHKEKVTLAIVEEARIKFGQ